MSRTTLVHAALFFFLVAAFGPMQAQAQSSLPTATPTGVALLTQSLTASGAANPLSPVTSFTATGTITYFWGEQVQAPATIYAKGSGQFRLDANLPSGTRSLAFSGNSGTLKDETGKLTQVPLHNTFGLAESLLPYLQIAAILADPTFVASDLGLVQVENQQLHQVRIIKSLPVEQDPYRIVATLSQTDYFLDPTTNLVVQIRDMTHPVGTLTLNYPRQIDLQNYTTINGVAVPSLMIERINDQKIWQFTQSTVTFNTNPPDSDFTLTAATGDQSGQ